MENWYQRYEWYTSAGPWDEKPEPPVITTPEEVWLPGEITVPEWPTENLVIKITSSLEKTLQ